MLVLWRKPLNVETADYVQIPWVWPRGVLPKTQKRSNAPHAGHAFATNPLLSPWVARGLPGGRPLGMAADTRIKVGIESFEAVSDFLLVLILGNNVFDSVQLVSCCWRLPHFVDNRFLGIPPN